jgi:hypothetical protein
LHEGDEPNALTGLRHADAPTGEDVTEVDFASAEAWVDLEGYRRWVASKRRAFEDEVDREMSVEKGQAAVR